VNYKPHFRLAPQPPYPQFAETPYARNRSRDARDLAGNFIVVHVHQARDNVASGVEPDVHDQDRDGKTGKGIRVWVAFEKCETQSTPRRS